MRRSVMAFVLAFVLSSLALAASPREREFTFTYAFTVRNLNPGKALRVWFPLAQSDQWQHVRIISAKGDLPLRQTRESKYGNRLYYAETAAANKPEYHFEVVYAVTREERLGLQQAGTIRLKPAALKGWLEPDKLVPVTGEPAQIAARVVQGHATELDKARALYDYVFQTMRYDKSGTGWGRGDALWACGAKRGNCTDFHSLFAAMARSQGIPTRFAIGFALPEDKHAGEIPGYHCWADFYVNSKGWVPVDISEAWQQHKHDYFFGAHDENRIQFSIGRDLVLSPRQNGPARNYLVYPYVESGGKEWPNVSYGFSFQDKAPVEQAEATRSVPLAH
jgi:transglutaminase-like putative cysteine protease